jgi:hypothetical protein
MLCRKKKYNEGKIRPIISKIIDAIKANPGASTNPVYLESVLANNLPELYNPKVCANCGGSMVMYEYIFDFLDAILLLAMAKKVKENTAEAITFADANIVRVQQLPGLSLSIKCRTTIMSKLGLVSMCRAKGQRIPGMWLITKRGWAAIRGEQIPKSVIVYHNVIQDRPEELTTLSEAFKIHTDKVLAVRELHKLPKTDYRHLYEDYEPVNWVNFGEIYQGHLI